MCLSWDNKAGIYLKCEVGFCLGLRISCLSLNKALAEVSKKNHKRVLGSKMSVKKWEDPKSKNLCFLFWDDEDHHLQMRNPSEYTCGPSGVHRTL